MRHAALALALAACTATTAAAEIAPADLYTAQVRVTGQGEATRAAGFARALREVIAKLAGDPRLMASPAVDAPAADAGAMVAAFSYRDLMAGIPSHDERGSRDRPFELTVRFAPARVDAALAALGRRPWPLPRPRVVALIAVHPAGGAAYALSADGVQGRDPRESLREAAWRAGLPLVLPREEALAAGALAAAPLEADAAALAALARASGGTLVLAGQLTWSDSALGWIGEWRLDAPAGAVRWRIGGVTFDDAFRNAAGGAARVLSGSGPPD